MTQFFGLDSFFIRTRLLPALRGIRQSKTKSGFLLCAIGAVLYILHVRQQREAARLLKQYKGAKLKSAKKGGKGHVDKEFFERIPELIKIAIPSWKSREVRLMGLLTVFLVLRTGLSISLASVNGAIVKAIVERNFQLFIKRLLILAGYALPASYVNSYLEYLNKSLALSFRRRMVEECQNKYLNGVVYYQLTNLDNRISNPEQRMTQDIEKWSQTLAGLYNNFTKPLLDIVLFSRKLAEIMGWQGPFTVITFFFFSAIVIKFVSPPFGKLAAIEQKLEGVYRGNHSALLNYCEEIAFYRGADWEKNRINNSFKELLQHSRNINDKKLFLGTFDSMMVKYGAVMVGYAVLGLPVFGPRSAQYLATIKSDPSAITRDYIRNSSLLINLAKAIGRIVLSYKDIQNLAGYTSLVYELREVLNELNHGVYRRNMVEGSKYRPDNKERGEIVESDTIAFEGVPIVSPNGDILVDSINFQLKPGMNCFITGPNGCGKSSLFRILGELWPIFGGKLAKPTKDSIFYIPQRPYLPAGTLRDQIIYPDSKLMMLRKGVTEDDLKELLKIVELSHVVDREGGWDAYNDWNSVLGGGDKQKMAMARLLYHKPKFAILDECTSAVAIDIEAKIYTYCKESGVTLITVSHRPTLWQYHEYLIRFDGNGGWKFETLEHKK
eukprot:CAMPEP_0114997472 /NCGR_PEP_ID=MMETSP0216-20121206/14920_1 /TAXON_ID=223996 /ORGANISM="Protocruzia adherens, Strain Boccale" /LENGTH=665 /DNA_ID=CAMNT_0002361861 /DNA_START=11 /DNA_END=2008 /DNA_ORIENTATION=+